MSDLKSEIGEIGRRAKRASRPLAAATREQKDAALRAVADELLAQGPRILAENTRDLEEGERQGLGAAMLDRLRLDQARLEEMARGVRAVANLPDPVGEPLREWTRPNGIRISKVRTPIGVIGIIYESRPNVTSDAAVLCLKAGNATILRGGSEAIRSNLAIAGALRAGIQAAGLPIDAVLVVPTTHRDAVRIMAGLSESIDLLVPRGGRGLIEAVMEHARVPVIKHYDGLCILYVDRDADIDMATRIVLNAKCQRPGVCNAIETLLVHRDIAPRLLPALGTALRACGVEIRADPSARTALGDDRVRPAAEADWHTEFLDLILAVGVVEDLDAAIAHVNANGSHHSDAIVTRDPATAERFLREVDSATVYWNASTRFTDGGEFGFGAEIGISTDKIHARGPMALEELTTYKYLIRGDGQVRQ